MNRLLLAIKAFFKALKAPEEARLFLTPPPKRSTKADPAIKEGDVAEQSHLRLLALLQQSGRLIDFLQEDISNFEDAQIGSVVRGIHGECKKTIEELVTVRPIMEQNEGGTFTVPAGYDPSQIKIVGKIIGEPPFTGIIVHRGWKAHKKSLPKKSGEQFNDILAAAEIEVRAR